jgi:hypothetical protein
LTSPVAGALGRFAVDKGGQINLQQDRFAALASDSAEVRLQGKNRVSSRDFVAVIRRMAKE